MSIEAARLWSSDGIHMVLKWHVHVMHSVMRTVCERKYCHEDEGQGPHVLPFKILRGIFHNQNNLNYLHVVKDLRTTFSGRQ